MYNDKKLHLLYEKGLSAMNESKVEKIIPPEQREVAHFLRQKVFSQIPKNHFFLVGGTAVALKYGHRQSIDFDFFPSHNSLLIIMGVFNAMMIKKLWDNLILFYAERGYTKEKMCQ